MKDDGRGERAGSRTVGVGVGGGLKGSAGARGEMRREKADRGVSAVGGKAGARGKENEATGAKTGRVAGKSTVPAKKRSPAPAVDRGLLLLERNPDKTESRKKPGKIKTPVKNPAAEEKMLKAAAKLC